MSTPDEKFENKDLIGRIIQQGDWIVQSHNLGRCAAIKLAYVKGFAKTGKLQLIGFEADSWYAQGGIHATGPYTVSNPQRSFVVPLDTVPPEYIQKLAEFLQERETKI